MKRHRPLKTLHGERAILTALREALTEWKVASYKECKQKCVITGRTIDLDVHHVTKKFEDIAMEAFDNLNIRYRQNREDYSSFEIELLQEEVLRLHFKYGLGVVLYRPIHKFYHLRYRDDISEATFQQFVSDYEKNRKAS